ncbi:MAG: J domain-containing protein [Proteobacteria bacterium]|nr:J domain-containing protein [Pseudomonadota bacterium]
MRGAYKLHPFLEEGPKRETTSCMHAQCCEEGTYPAPRSASRLEERYWFCLEHVKAYNASWNYYANMGEDEIEASRRSDTTWCRPTWPFAMGAAFGKSFVFEGIDLGETAQTRTPLDPAMGKQEREALAVLNLSSPLTQDILKTRYKILAKRFHPDLNQGCKQAEETLKNINQAYATLQKFLKKSPPKYP